MSAGSSFDNKAGIISSKGDSLVLHFRESPFHSVLPELIKDLTLRVQSQPVARVQVIIEETVSCNTVLFIFTEKLEEICRQKGIKVEYSIGGDKNLSASQIFRHYLAQGKKSIPSSDVKSRVGGLNFIARIGEIGLLSLGRCIEALKFFSDNLRSTFIAIAHPRIIRWRELAYVLEQTGSRAMSIVGIMSFLIGLVTAFQAAVQLRQFGANIFVADLAALGLSRELSPLITAVLMAGRTTSAFAAEIGIMKINEELDALKVMNVDVSQFLIVPRIVGALVAAPLLTVWSLFTGLLGAMFVAFASLDVTPVSFVSEAYSILNISDLWVGFLKSVLFGIIVGSVGCYMGVRTSHSPESVGKQTTSAVVAALFLIIIADAFVTVLANVFRW